MPVEQVAKVRPRLFYRPCVTDLPEDHRQTCRLFEAASRARGATVPANCVADISAVSERKQVLIGVYASQLRDVDCHMAVEEQNRYCLRLLAATREARAETFFECCLRGRLQLRAHMHGGSAVPAAQAVA